MNVTEYNNGYSIEIDSYGYMVPTRKHVDVIEAEYECTGRTPTDIIDAAIKILREKGCQRGSQLPGMVGVSPYDFIVFKQAEPKANNMLKMARYNRGFVTFIRGTAKYEDEYGAEVYVSPIESRPTGVKTKTEVPLIREGLQGQ